MRLKYQRNCMRFAVPKLFVVHRTIVSNHTANDCKNDFLCLKHYVFVYIVDSDLCQREYFSKLSNTRTPVILLFSRVYTELRSRVSCRSYRTGTNWMLSGHNHQPTKPRARGYLGNDYRNEKRILRRVFCYQTRGIARNISSLTSK